MNSNIVKVNNSADVDKFSPFLNLKSDIILINQKNY